MNKSLKILGVAFLVMSFIWALTQTPSPSTKPETPAFPSTVEQVTITGKTMITPVELTSDGSIWTLNAPPPQPANEAFVAEFIKELRNVRLETVLSRRAMSEDILEMFQLDTAHALTVSVWADKNQKPLVWWVGKNAPDGLHIYVRKPSDPTTVFLAKGMRRERLETPIEKWQAASPEPKG